MMALTLDNLAHRYSCLPSEALERGTTLDLYVLDVSAKWSKYQSNKAEGKNSVTITPKLSQAEMQAMIKRVQERRDD
jgi:hypothetical protein